jgi:hypothetical protein
MDAFFNNLHQDCLQAIQEPDKETNRFILQRLVTFIDFLFSTRIEFVTYN